MQTSFETTGACSITVISTAGERRTFEATGHWATSLQYRCQTGMGQGIEITPFSVYPSQITVTFPHASGDTAGNDGGGAMDSQQAVDINGRSSDAADRQDAPDGE